MFYLSFSKLKKTPMKKILPLFFVIIISVTSVRSQITITGADMPQDGVSVITATDTLNSVNLGSPGASSQIWNFSSLTPSYYSFPTYSLTSATPYAAAFAASNIYTYGPAAFYSSLYGATPVGTQGMNKGYMFWESDNTGFSVVGFRADSGAYSNINVLENPKELLIAAPATYGTPVFNNMSRWELPMNVNPADADTFYVVRSTKTITVDAWGSLTTPFGTFSNVLREHEYRIKIDSAYGKMGTVPIYAIELMRDTANNYIYLANGLHYPVAIVHANKNNVIKDVEYYSGVYVGINDVVVENNTFSVYPNPSNGNYNLVDKQNKLMNSTFQIVNMLGEVIHEGKINDRTTLIDINSQASGIYLLNVYTPEGLLKTKLLKN